MLQSGARAVTLASDDDIDHPLSGFAEELLQYAVEGMFIFRKTFLLIYWVA